MNIDLWGFHNPEGLSQSVHQKTVSKALTVIDN